MYAIRSYYAHGNVLRLDLSMPNLGASAGVQAEPPDAADDRILTEQEMEDLRKRNIARALELTDGLV